MDEKGASKKGAPEQGQAQASGGNTARNDATRRAIIEAFLGLLQEKRFSEITVTDIVARAGVARMSYYRNFDSKEQVIEAYIDGLRESLLAGDATGSAGTSVVALGESAGDIIEGQALAEGFTHSLRCMLIERDNMLALVGAGFATTLQRIMDGYIEERLGGMPAASVERFGLYFASGALLNVLVRWLEQGARESPEELAAFCARLLREGMTRR